jgi:hypothetical protein
MKSRLLKEIARTISALDKFASDWEKHFPDTKTSLPGLVPGRQELPVPAGSHDAAATHDSERRQ